MQPKASGVRGGAPPPRLDLLFAYGTLMAGESRRPLLDPAVLEGGGRVRGSLYDFGEYPGLVLDEGGWVVGELYRVPDLAARLPLLDREEGYTPTDPAGSLYVRNRAPVQASDGVSSCEAWVYVYNGPAGRGRRIASGDWRAHVLARGAGSVDR
ncbi:MAG: gamma-glutamylcyclotransferase family protein [Candidatus Rokuibacteriota bacterium]